MGENVIGKINCGIGGSWCRAPGRCRRARDSIQRSLECLCGGGIKKTKTFSQFFVRRIHVVIRVVVFFYYLCLISVGRTHIRVEMVSVRIITMPVKDWSRVGLSLEINIIFWVDLYTNMRVGLGLGINIIFRVDLYTNMSLLLINQHVVIFYKVMLSSTLGSTRYIMCVERFYL